MTARLRQAAPEELTKDERERAYREEVLREKQREATRDFRIENAGQKIKQREKERERDIGEKMALGQQGVQPTRQEAMYDARLFNQQAGGMDSGFAPDD